MTLSPSTIYYRTHPEARRRRVEAQAKINRRPEEKRRRAKLIAERRKRGINGKGGPDISHTTKGTTLEDPSTNRARNGHGGPRLRADAAKGKPCGESFIPRQAKCSKGTRAGSPLSPANLAKVAAVAGTGLGIAALLRHRARLSPERADQISNEAQAHGQKWQPQEEINTRRQAERAAACSPSPLPPTKLDAFLPIPRTQCGKGSFGTYFVHPSQEYGVKVFRDPDDAPYANHEFNMQERAFRLGVNAPEPLSMRGTEDQPTIIMRHMKGYAPLHTAPYVPTNSTADYNLASAPLPVRLDLLHNVRKLHINGIAHGDLHFNNVVIHQRTNKVGLIDFGYSTNLSTESFETLSGRNGRENILFDMGRLNDRIGVKNFKFEYDFEQIRGNLDLVMEELYQGTNYTKSDRAYKAAINRYYSDLERAILRDTYALSGKGRPPTRSRLLAA